MGHRARGARSVPLIPVPTKKETSLSQFDYDVVVIGAGQGGLPAAHMAANLGARVALIEMAEVGGT